MAALHARCFSTPPPWSADAFGTFLAAPAVFVHYAPGGFVLGRVVVDEAELLTIAVDPATRRRGTGRALLAGFEATAHKRGATRAFLEVASDNGPARALYDTAGWRVAGTRRGYYRDGNGGRVDALVLEKGLRPGSASV